MEQQLDVSDLEPRVPLCPAGPYVPVKVIVTDKTNGLAFIFGEPQAKDSPCPEVFAVDQTDFQLGNSEDHWIYQMHADPENMKRYPEVAEPYRQRLDEVRDKFRLLVEHRVKLAVGRGFIGWRVRPHSELVCVYRNGTKTLGLFHEAILAAGRYQTSFDEAK